METPFGSQSREYPEHGVSMEVVLDQEEETDDVDTMEMKFSEWKKGISEAKTYTEFLWIFERMPFSTAGSDLENFLFGEEGLFTQAKDKKEFPLPVDDDDYNREYSYKQPGSYQQGGYELSLYTAIALKLKGVVDYVNPEKIKSLTRVLLKRNIEFVERSTQQYYVEKVGTLRQKISRKDNPYMYKHTKTLILILTKFPGLATDGEVADLKKKLEKMSKKLKKLWDRSGGIIDDTRYNVEGAPFNPAQTLTDKRWEEFETVYYSEDFANDNGIVSLVDVIEVCAVIKDKETVPLIADALAAVPPGYVNKDVAYALEKIDASGSGKELLNRIRSEGASLEEKSIYGRVFRLLELGKIGVHKDVVNYIDLQFELTGTDKQFAFARRITGDGKIGLFKADGSWSGAYIELGDLSDPELKRSAEVLEVTREQLFADPNTPDDIRESFIKDYTAFYENTFGEVGGVRLSDLTLREQVWVYVYHAKATPKLWDQFLSFKEDYGIEGVKTFIAAEVDHTIGERVLAFSQDKRIPTETKKEVFGVYGHMIDKLDTVKDEARDFFSEEVHAQHLDLSEITTQIAKRAARTLEHAMTHLESGQDAQKTVKQLREVRADAVLFASIFRAAFKGKKEMRFEDVRGLDFEMVGPEILTNEDKDQMRDIMRRNNLDKKGDVRAFAQKVVMPSLEKSFTDESNRFFVLRQNGRIIGYFRMQDTEQEDDTYFGSFNIDTDATGAGIGTILMEKRFRKEAKGKTLAAHVEIDNPAATAYMNTHEFVITKFLENVEGTETDGFEIARYDGTPFLSRQKNVVPLKEGYILREDFNILTDRAGFKRRMEELVNSGKYVVTEYAFNKKTGECHCVFENNSSTQSHVDKVDELPRRAA